MESIKKIYRIGYGPSSSHTMAPRRAAQIFLENNADAASFRVTLYGSLAATGRGHLTDVAILDVLSPVAPTHIEWLPKVVLPEHPNGMKFEAFDADGNLKNEWTTFSLGGGALSDDAHDDETRSNHADKLKVLCKTPVSSATFDVSLVP